MLEYLGAQWTVGREHYRFDVFTFGSNSQGRVVGIQPALSRKWFWGSHPRVITNLNWLARCSLHIMFAFLAHIQHSQHTVTWLAHSKARHM